MQHRDSSSPSTVLFHQKLVGKFNSWEWTCSRHTCAHIHTHSPDSSFYKVRYNLQGLSQKHTCSHNWTNTIWEFPSFKNPAISLCSAPHPQVWLSGFCCPGWAGRQSYRLHWCSPTCDLSLLLLMLFKLVPIRWGQELLFTVKCLQSTQGGNLLFTFGYRSGGYS